MRVARFTRTAKAELLAQIAYYEAEERSLGARFRREVEDTANRAAEFPKHGKPAAAGTRRRLVNDFYYSVVYTETNYSVLVHAVAADRLPPEYWLSRIPR